jgi:hypothetical protein
MAQYTLTPGIVPPTIGYPGNIQDLMELIKNYMTVVENLEFKTFIVSNTQPAPTSGNQDKIWFELSSTGNPKAIRLYNNGNWLEFVPFNQGDLVLIADTVIPESPWGEPNTSYQVNVFSGVTVTQISFLTPTAPTAPVGFKYKVYVGHYS